LSPAPRAGATFSVRFGIARRRLTGYPVRLIKRENIVIIVTGEIRIPAERMEEARPHMRAVLEATRREAGCLLYAFGEDVIDPGLIRIVERWDDWAALAAHGKSDHVGRWADFLRQVGVSGRDLDAHEGSNGRKI
jgi:quinol monooxygenase YgiN